MLVKDNKNWIILSVILMMAIMFGSSSADSQTEDQRRNYDYEWSKRFPSQFVPVRGRSNWPDLDHIDRQELVSIKQNMSRNNWDTSYDKRNTINNLFMPMRGRKFDNNNSNGKDGLQVIEGKRSTFTAMRGKKITEK